MVRRFRFLASLLVSLTVGAAGAQTGGDAQAARSRVRQRVDVWNAGSRIGACPARTVQAAGVSSARGTRVLSTVSDSAYIRAAIERGARGFEHGAPDSILAHYAPDVILSYPGIPDQDYATLARGYNELRKRPPGTRATTTPTFDEIIITRDIAVVRLRWRTAIREAAHDAVPAGETIRYLRDLQVWRRESSCEWRFVRGMHYRDSTAAPASESPQ